MEQAPDNEVAKLQNVEDEEFDPGTRENMIDTFRAEKEATEVLLQKAEKGRDQLQTKLILLGCKLEKMEELINWAKSKMLPETTMPEAVLDVCGNPKEELEKEELENEEILRQIGDIMKDMVYLTSLSFAFKEIGGDSDFEPDDPFSFSEEVLTNPLLISKILSLLPLNSLFKLRTVHSSWNKAIIYILTYKKVFKISNTTLTRVEQQGSSEFPFRPSKLKFFVDFVVRPFRKTIQEFFERFKRDIRYLGLFCEEQHYKRIYSEEFVNIFLARLPYLKELELSLPMKITQRVTLHPDHQKAFKMETLKRISLIQSEPGGGFSIGFTKELFEMAPKMEHLRLETHDLDVVTRVLISLRDCDLRYGLRSLEMHCYMSEIHLEMLNELPENKCRLEKLQLSYFTSQVNFDSVENFVGRNKNLKILAIGDYKRQSPEEDPFMIKMPKLANLEELVLIDPCFGQERRLRFLPINWKEDVPNLGKIILDHEAGVPAGSHYFWDFLTSNCNSVNEFHICNAMPDVQTLLQSVSEKFIGLKRLVVKDVPDAAIRSVWQHFPLLEDLEIHFGFENKQLDSLITGIPREICCRIQEHNLFQKVDLMELVTVIRTESSICNLTELRTVKFDGTSACSLITAVTGYLGLMFLKNLKALSIRSDLITISKECRRVLGEKLDLTVFDIF